MSSLRKMWRIFTVYKYNFIGVYIMNKVFFYIAILYGIFLLRKYTVILLCNTFKWCILPVFFLFRWKTLSFKYFYCLTSDVMNTQVVRIRGRRRRREEGRRRDWIPKVKKEMVTEGVVVQRKRRRKRKNRVGGIRVVGSNRSWFACTHLHQLVVLRRGRLSNIMTSLLSVIKTKD